MSFREITDEIVARHHSYLRKELPAISSLLDELGMEFADSTGFDEVRSLFKKIRKKIETHLKDEETVLFPTGSALESGLPPPAADFDLLARLNEMEQEHENCGNALRLLVQMLSDLPVSQLQSTAIASVKNLCADLDEHVAKENEKVHPRFLELMKARSS